MDSKFDKMLEKKGKKLSPVEQKAKGDVLSDLRDQASGMMSDKLGSLKKVSVMAPDEEGLKEGLDKAKDFVSDMPKDDQYLPEEVAKEHGVEQGSNEEGEKEEGSEDEMPSSLDEIEKKIEMLMQLKEHLSKNK